MMKVNILDAHDRYTYITKKEFDIGECCQDLINKRPFGDHAFYIFAHPRTDDDGINKRMVWQPRLTKPKAQTNSMLFKGYPGTDIIKIIWMIPVREVWSQFNKGLLLENRLIHDSIHDFQYNRSKLEEREPDDLSDEVINNIYIQIGIEAKRKSKQKILVDSSACS